jgi:hypothetical protein
VPITDCGAREICTVLRLRSHGERSWKRNSNAQRDEVAGLRSSARSAPGAAECAHDVERCQGACASRCCARPLRRAKQAVMSSHSHRHRVGHFGEDSAFPADESIKWENS